MSFRCLSLVGALALFLPMSRDDNEMIVSRDDNGTSARVNGTWIGTRRSTHRRIDASTDSD
jgi:hypothetical protein